MRYPRPRSTLRVPTRCRLRDALKAALILATSVSCAPEQAVESLVRLSPVASIPAPLSTSTEITLVDEDTACVINSYEVQVRCSDRAGLVVGAFGREGEGPGEFLAMGALERGPDGTIGVFDWRAGRMTDFRPDGVRLSETPVPRLFLPAAPFGSVINGYYLALPSDTVVGLAVLADVDVTSGEVLWARDGLDDLIESECGWVAPGRPIPGGGYVFRSCQSELVWFTTHRNGSGLRLPGSVTASRTWTSMKGPNTWGPFASETGWLGTISLAGRLRYWSTGSLASTELRGEPSTGTESTR